MRLIPSLRRIEAPEAFCGVIPKSWVKTHGGGGIPIANSFADGCVIERASSMTAGQGQSRTKSRKRCPKL